MAFIATEWTPDSPTDVRVFSNGDEVELRLNGSVVARRGPDRDRISAHLAHPPFTFPLGRFTPGTLEAIAYVGGREAARHAVRTPGLVERLALTVDLAGRPVARGAKDVLLCHAALEDAHGTTLANAWENVAFGTTGGAEVVGANPFSSDAGIASIVALTTGAPAALYALAIVRASGDVRVLGASSGIVGAALPFELRYTTDGSAPGASSPRYTAPLTTTARLRAALVASGRVVATLDETAAKFRIRGSSAPATREQFHHG